ncbi:MAG: RNA polymerase sigma factor [Defluviitaleaceae bacterium]|nr:RNA polymerase sigma factor [Defluviitaleaceae bacterium]
MELSQRFAGGGETELEEVITCFGEKLVRYAASVLYSHQDAEDVVQEVFLWAYQNRARFDGKNLSAWLYRITYRDCLDKIRGQKRRKLLFLFDTKEEPAVYMEDTVSITEIAEALKPLAPKERALLYGRIVDGLSYEELSQIMDATPSALRKMYERTKKKAAKYLDACGYALPITGREGSRF